MENSKKSTKILIIAGIFLLPAFFILIFKTGKANFYDLKYYGDHQVLTNTHDGITSIDTLFYKVDKYTFTDHLGQPLTEKNLTNKILIVNIIHGNCPSENCNLDFLSFKKFIGKEVMGNKKFADIEILSSFVPSNPKKAQKEMTDFIAFHEINTEKWNIVSGDMGQFYNTNMEIQNPWLEKDTVFGYSNVAQSMALLIDRKGHIRGKYIVKYTSEIKRITKEISILLKEEEDAKK
jgi:cytochrome oxidase Cu insertion factor (SCO1/SenC/PrrC family)